MTIHSNKNFHKAKRVKNDEFYTRRTDIERELQHYWEHFRGKTIYCNCDDPVVSEFFNYFAYNFQFLGLKKLIATCYKSDDANLFSTHASETGKYLEFNGEYDGNMPDTTKYITKSLRGDGDFRSNECIELLKQADIVVTNPPFSLFREYLSQLIQYNKKFLIIGPLSAVVYKTTFPLIKDTKLWLGNNLIRVFDKPDKTTGGTASVWYTNLHHNRQNEEIILYRKYEAKNYPTYDNYDAINVDKVNGIPKDYDELMGVPITFLTKYNPKQFKIIGLGMGNLFRELNGNGLSKKFVDDYYKSGGTGRLKEDHPLLGYYDNNGVAKIPYARIIIRNKEL